MKAIMMSIKPQYVAKILNGEKTIEIRKKFPKDYVGWVYIYVTKGNGLTEHHYEYVDENGNPTGEWYKVYDYGLIRFLNGRVATLTSSTRSRKEELESEKYLNGKVVARFWCDKVEEISKIIMYDRPFNLFETEALEPDELLKQSCLTAEEMTMYFMFSNLPKESAAIHVKPKSLEIFDKPKEISEFKAQCSRNYYCDGCPHYWTDDSAGYSIPKCSKLLTSAPQNYCFVEI